MAERAHALLQSLAGSGAAFRPGQLEAVTALVEQRERVLLVQSSRFRDWLAVQRCGCSQARVQGDPPGLASRPPRSRPLSWRCLPSHRPPCPW
jgi:hypothetical protein